MPEPVPKDEPVRRPVRRPVGGSDEPVQGGRSRGFTAVRDLRADRRGAALLAEYCRLEEPEVFRQLFEEVGPALLPLLRVRVRRFQPGLDPTELLLDTFEQIFKARSTFEDRGPGSFLRWFLTIAENLVRQRRRESARRSRREQAAAAEIADRTTDPHEILVREEGRDEAHTTYGHLRTLVFEAVEQLPPNQRQALLLASMHRCRYADIGRHLGISVGAVTMRIKRARDTVLRHLLHRLDSDSQGEET